MEITVNNIENKELWEKFVQSRQDQACFLQSWYWGETHVQLGRKIFRLGFWNNNELQGVALVIKQEARRGNYFECPAGPIIDWDNPQLFNAFIEKMRDLGRSEGCVFVRIRPQKQDSAEGRTFLRSYGFIKSPMHLHAQDTWVLSLNADEQMLLDGMRKTTRYLVRKAVKDGVAIEKSNNLSDVDILFELQKDTAKRHHFVPFGLDFFRAHFSAFSGANHMLIFKAIYQHEVASIAMIVFYGSQAVYHYSASASKFAKIPASYLLQWEAIKEAKQRGCTVYDFWGIAPISSSDHRFAGVTAFKKGFGGYSINYLPAHDLPLRWNYYGVYFFETLRRIRRHL